MNILVWIPILLTVFAFVFPYVALWKDRRDWLAPVAYVFMLAPCLIVALLAWVAFAFWGRP